MSCPASRCVAGSRSQAGGRESGSSAARSRSRLPSLPLSRVRGAVVGDGCGQDRGIEEVPLAFAGSVCLVGGALEDQRTEFVGDAELEEHAVLDGQHENGCAVQGLPAAGHFEHMEAVQRGGSAAEVARLPSLSCHMWSHKRRNPPSN